MQRVRTSEGLCTSQLLGVLYTIHKRTHSHGRSCKIAQTPRLFSIGSFYGLEGQSGYSCTCRSKFEEKREPTSGLEPLTCSLRVRFEEFTCVHGGA
jgi:hypothetical protein